jgi:hypothetical protein
MRIAMSAQDGIPPKNFVYERRSSTLVDPIPSGASGYVLLRWSVPSSRNHLLLYGIGTDQHLDSTYTWVVDGVVLPISGEARVGTPEEPYMFPEPLYVSGTIILYISNDSGVGYPNTGTAPDDEYPYECLIVGRYG